MAPPPLHIATSLPPTALSPSLFSPYPQPHEPALHLSVFMNTLPDTSRITVPYTAFLRN